MNRKVEVFFEFRLPLISYCVISIIILFLYRFHNLILQPLNTIYSQVGGMLIFIGFLLRVFTTSTSVDFDKTKITGIYALCRQPLLLSQFIVFVGFNIIVLNIFFTTTSLLTFLINDYLCAKKYDKILSHYHKNTWKTYTKHIHLFIPTLSNIQQILTPQTISVKKTNKNQNMPIFFLIYTVLIEIATLSGL